MYAIRSYYGRGLRGHPGLIAWYCHQTPNSGRGGWRNRMQARLGEVGWKGLYSLISIAGFVLVVQGYAAARLDPVVLYTPPTSYNFV